MKGQFTLEDWLDQMKQMKKMGPLAQIMDMLPGQMGQAARQVDPKESKNPSSNPKRSSIR